MLYEEFKNQVKAKYAEKFNGLCSVKKYVSFGKYITITCYMNPYDGKTTFENDMIRLSIAIELPGKFDFESDELPEKMTYELWHNSYLIKPENKYLVYNSRKIPGRKTTGAAEKIILSLAKLFDKLNAMLKEDLSNNNIHEHHIKTVTENLI